MKKDLVELVFILDRSGSMGGLESDTIGGFNAMLEKQKQEAGEAIVTTVLFDDKVELLHDRTCLQGVNPITSKEYFVRGTTGLLDALGSTIGKTLNATQNTAEEARAEKVMVIVTTDGLENASREYGYAKVKSLISQTKEQYGWEYIFLGANMDAALEAKKFGIDANNAVDYHADSAGTELNYMVMSEAISSVRKTKSLGKKWRKQMDDDFKARK